MTHFVTIDELEREIQYLREQNQKIIKELSQVVKENRVLREELALQRRGIYDILEDDGQEPLKKKDGKSGEEGEELCLN
jgi:regulator of replication initiation timing